MMLQLPYSELYLAVVVYCAAQERGGFLPNTRVFLQRQELLGTSFVFLSASARNPGLGISHN